MQDMPRVESISMTSCEKSGQEIAGIQNTRKRKRKEIQKLISRLRTGGLFLELFEELFGVNAHFSRGQNH
jgi:hypothetical protein